MAVAAEDHFGFTPSHRRLRWSLDTLPIRRISRVGSFNIDVVEHRRLHNRSWSMLKRYIAAIGAVNGIWQRVIVVLLRQSAAVDIAEVAFGRLGFDGVAPVLSFGDR